MFAKLRMYILVKDSVPDDYVPLMVAHAAVNCYHKFNGSFIEKSWIDEHNMAKVICRVNDREFEHAIKLVHKSLGDYIIQSETNGLDPEHLTDCVAAFAPRYEYPKCFQFFKLWKVKQAVKETLPAKEIIDTMQQKEQVWQWWIP